MVSASRIHGISSKIHSFRRRTRLPLFTIIVILVILYITALLLIKVDDLATRIASDTKTVAGHNLEAVPWHLFPPKEFNDDGGGRYSKASKLFKCSYLACGFHSNLNLFPHRYSSGNSSGKCPKFFQWIHHDLEPWAESRISQANLMEAQKFAAFRVVIVGGRLYVDFYYGCVQGRMMFTIWGLLQMLRRYPGIVPDVDIMFDCMDRPFIKTKDYKKGSKWPPPPLFRYCTTPGHFDIPLPDWSFWGWSEINIGPWDEEFRNIKRGSQALNWTQKLDHAFWKGNPDVGSPLRVELLKCNDIKKWGAEVHRQNWVEEGKIGFKQSNRADQCKHRYKIYAEGYAWSVSLKYILSCGSLSLIISQEFEDFFTRGLSPTKNYWPVSRADLCRSIKFAVDWGNAHPSEAEAIGKGAQDLMSSISMERVYDYMYHMIAEYSKLQDFKPIPPPTAQEICVDSVLCIADPAQKRLLEKSLTSPSTSLPCTLPPADHNFIEKWIQKKRKVTSNVQRMERTP